MYYMYNVQLLYIVHCMYTIYIVLKLEKILGFRHPLSQVRSYLIRFQLPQHHLTDSTPELTINLLSAEISWACNFVSGQMLIVLIARKTSNQGQSDSDLNVAALWFAKPAYMHTCICVCALFWKLHIPTIKIQYFYFGRILSLEYEEYEYGSKWVLEIRS